MLSWSGNHFGRTPGAVSEKQKISVAELCGGPFSSGKADPTYCRQRLPTMNRVIVTGGSGFIGTHLMSYLLERSHQVLNLDRSKPLNASQNLLHHQVDILDAATLRAELES